MARLRTAFPVLCTKHVDEQQSGMPVGDWAWTPWTPIDGSICPVEPVRRPLELAVSSWDKGILCLLVKQRELHVVATEMASFPHRFCRFCRGCPATKKWPFLGPNPLQPLPLLCRSRSFKGSKLESTASPLSSMNRHVPHPLCLRLLASATPCLIGLTEHPPLVLGSPEEPPPFKLCLQNRPLAASLGGICQHTTVCRLSQGFTESPSC